MFPSLQIFSALSNIQGLLRQLLVWAWGWRETVSLAFSVLSGLVCQPGCGPHDLLAGGGEGYGLQLLEAEALAAASIPATVWAV